MKIMLVNPPRFEGLPVIREERCEITERYSVLEPYSLLQLAAILRDRGHNIALLDANGFDYDYAHVEKKLADVMPDVLIFRFTPTTFDHDTSICAIVRELNPKIKTIGLCWTLNKVPKDVMDSVPELDYYATGDYETVVPSIIEKISDVSGIGGLVWRSGKDVIINTPTRGMIANLDELPIPAYDLLDSLDPYFINTPTDEVFTIMYTSRGCPYGCIYCTVAGTVWKPRSAESVMKELRYLKKKYNVKLVSFFDETFTIDKQRIMDICRAMVEEKLDIKWYCNTRANLLDEELIIAMRDAGCRGMSIGVESGSQKILDMASKRITVEEARNVIRLAKKHGLKVLCSFIFGLPGETWDTVDETIQFVKNALPTGVQFNVAVPYPGTELHRWAIEKGLLKETGWRHLYQHESVVGTEDMSPEDLNKARYMAYKALYTYPIWYLENIKHVLKNPEDFNMAVKYSIKIINNFVLHRMEHSH
ncbi:MAG: radical SAM protein [Euryarchaeota archaeon]|nr:radical SAM protein [Euryarchaeota archaeon]MBU4032152.1 B12-binding domain-containing radical SAM protein [Candidatus Thermoplasmatota archaeon]MBU4071168.1 B12-binding domain-containing radical SAM protein [Candidatus Thermoplasmatota archaeon]MBU4143864.1 B12-binding domain-containing radical SAM protein [Candidatus Thermoplasmatota archaeon]